jgi:hypothetical protein
VTLADQYPYLGLLSETIPEISSGLSPGFLLNQGPGNSGLLAACWPPLWFLLIQELPTPTSMMVMLHTLCVGPWECAPDQEQNPSEQQAEDSAASSIFHLPPFHPLRQRSLDKKGTYTQWTGQRRTARDSNLCFCA